MNLYEEDTYDWVEKTIDLIGFIFISLFFISLPYMGAYVGILGQPSTLTLILHCLFLLLFPYGKAKYLKRYNVNSVFFLIILWALLYFLPEWINIDILEQSWWYPLILGLD